MGKLLKIIGGIFLIIIVIGIIGAAAGGKKSSNSGSDANSNQPVQEAKQQVQESMVIKASELADDFDSNQVAAESKWKGKLVQFTAEITNITQYGLSFSKVASKQFSMTQISCKVTDKQQLLALKNGQTVTVKGVVGGQTIGVIDVSDCLVVQ